MNCKQGIVNVQQGKVDFYDCSWADLGQSSTGEKKIRIINKEF